MIDITVKNRACLHCGKPIRELKDAPEIAIHVLSERRMCDSSTYAEFSRNGQTDDIIPKAEMHFAPSQTDEHKAKAYHFVAEIEWVCRKYGLVISATDTDGLCIYDAEIEAYTWNIGHTKREED